MTQLHRALLTGVFLTLAAVSAQAETVHGALSLNGFNVSVTDPSVGSTLADATKIVAGSTIYGGTATGSFAPIESPSPTVFAGNTVDLNNLTAFTLNLGNFGMFTVTGVGSGGTVLTNPRKNEVLSVYFVGTFTPGAGLPGVTAGLASVLVNYGSVQNGVVSEGITLQAPPAVPEPASVALAGIGLAGLGLVRALRKRSV